MKDESLLLAYDIKPTAIRLLIIRSIKCFSAPFSFEELYEYLETVDRSTVFRTIVLFEKHKLLHGFDDGMGRRKYCLCHDMDVSASGECHNHDACHHIHLSCRVCGRTFCLPAEHTPVVHLPEDFEVEDINCIVTGICSHCKGHHSSRARIYK